LITRDELNSIDSIENGNLIIFNRTDDRIKLEVPFKVVGDIIDILRTAKDF